MCVDVDTNNNELRTAKEQTKKKCRHTVMCHIAKVMSHVMHIAW